MKSKELKGGKDIQGWKMSIIYLFWYAYGGMVCGENEHHLIKELNQIYIHVWLDNIKACLRDQDIRLGIMIITCEILYLQCHTNTLQMCSTQ